MNFKKLIALCGAAIVSIAPAFAGFNQDNAVTLGGQQMFNLASFDGMSASHRAWVTQDRLDNALFLSADKSPSTVSVAKCNGAVCLMIGGRCVISADSNSARIENMSPWQLANKWADKVKDFLASDQASSYIASLKRPNPLAADIAIVERRLYAPAGTVLPIELRTEISAATAKPGDRVEGIISKEVTLGNYAIPVGTVVLGELIDQGNGRLGMQLDTLKLASGTEIPISATMVETIAVATSGPHPVCTIGMPANEALSARVPATIGVGATDNGTVTSVALIQGGTTVFTSGQKFAAVLYNAQPVAVVTRSHQM